MSLAPAGQNPHVGVDDAGDAVAVWHSQTGGAQTSSLRAGGTWTTPKTLDTYGYDITALAVASDGAAPIGWGPTNDGPVLAAIGGVSGSWSAPTGLGTSGSSEPTLAIDAVGDIVAAFSEIGVSSQGTSTAAVYTVRHPANGTWGTLTRWSRQLRLERSWQPILIRVLISSGLRSPRLGKASAR